jgi:hypothetical protein
VFLEFNHEPKPCLNCILNPEKTIEATLSLSRNIGDTSSFIPINNAIVELYENDVFLSRLSFSSNGKYALNKKPEVGKQYKILVTIEGFKTLTATTKIPQAPEIAYEKTNYRKADYDQPQYDMNVELFDQPGKHSYWLYITSTVNGLNHGGGCIPVNAPFVDNFNREIDIEAELGFTFFLQMRISDEGFDGEILKFTIQGIRVMNEKQHSDQHFLGADEHYDKYIKTTLINRMKEVSDLPFYEPVQIYSNIENGYGIFGSCAITTIKL